MASEDLSGEAKLSPALAEWSRTGGTGESRTVVIRPAYSTDLAVAQRDLEAAGVKLESVGPGALTAVVTPESFGRLSTLDWVRAVEEPRTLALKGRVG